MLVAYVIHYSGGNEGTGPHLFLLTIYYCSVLGLYCSTTYGKTIAMSARLAAANKKEMNSKVYQDRYSAFMNMVARQKELKSRASGSHDYFLPQSPEVSKHWFVQLCQAHQPTLAILIGIILAFSQVIDISWNKQTGSFPSITSHRTIMPSSSHAIHSLCRREEHPYRD